MNYLDLFSGIGGFPLGAYWAGMRFENHYFSEVDKYAIKVYQRRFPDAIPLGDIREIDTEMLMADTLERQSGSRAKQQKGQKPVDGEQTQFLSDAGSRSRKTETGNNNWIITGGFPCQDISVAGKGEDIEGSRSGLWFEMWRIIRDLRPRFAIIENVGAITYRGLDTVLANLAEIGMDAEWQDIRASDVGAPHRRERIWIVAYPKSDEQRRLRQTQGKQQITIRGRSTQSVQDVADSSTQRLQNEDARTNRQGTYTKFARENSRRTGETWSVEPDVGRVAHGVPSRVDRLRCLGNAVVPQVAQYIGRMIVQAETT